VLILASLFTRFAPESVRIWSSVETRDNVMIAAAPALLLAVPTMVQVFPQLGLDSYASMPIVLAEGISGRRRFGHCSRR
jgi:lactate permease